MVDNTYKLKLERQWNEKFPTTLSGLFSFYQCLCTIAILGCEIGSILIDLFNATIYVGIWASLFFMIAWISQAVSASCRTTYKCATYTFVIQCIALFFAACVIGFDAYFLIYPTTCFFSSTLCNGDAPSRGLFYSVDNFNNIKIPLIKGQLATAAIVFAFSIDYIIMYIVIRVHIKNNTQSLLKPSTTNTTNRVSTNAVVLNTSENIKNTSALPKTNWDASPTTNWDASPTTNWDASPTTNRDTLPAIDISSETSIIKSINRSRWSSDSFNLSPIEI